MNNEIMSEEAFYELVDVLDIVSGLTMYGRKSLKYWINKIVAENKRQQKQIDLMAEKINMTKPTPCTRTNEISTSRVYMTKDEIKQYFERKVEDGRD